MFDLTLDFKAPGYYSAPPTTTVLLLLLIIIVSLPLGNLRAGSACYEPEAAAIL
jgi:hypothetical protein